MGQSTHTYADIWHHVLKCARNFAVVFVSALKYQIKEILQKITVRFKAKTNAALETHLSPLLLFVFM